MSILERATWRGIEKGKRMSLSQFPFLFIKNSINGSSQTDVFVTITTVCDGLIKLNWTNFCAINQHPIHKLLMYFGLLNLFGWVSVKI